MARRFLSPILALAGTVAVAGGGPEGRRLISQADMPLTITNAGSYLVTENLTLRNGVLIPAASTWRYRDDGSDQGSAWRGVGFDDAAWPAGRAELGYGDRGVEATTAGYGPSAAAKHITTYFRSTFVLTNAGAHTDLDLFVRRDDGILVYLNGTEVVRDNMPAGVVSFTTRASVEVPDGGAGGDPESEYRAFDVDHALLVNGTNVLAAEVHLAAADSADMSFDLALFGEVTGAAGTPANGITIDADNVTLDLNGHTLTGVELGTLDGIHLVRGANVTIRNGTLTEWGGDGIDALNTTNCRIEAMRVIRNFEAGIRGGYGALVLNCQAHANGMTRTAFEEGDGIRVEEGSLVRGCISRGNHNHAVDAGSSCDILDTVVTRNGHDGLHGGQGNVISRFIAASSFVTAANKRGDGMEINVGSVALACTAYQMDDGMKTRNESAPTPDGRSLFIRCTAYSNWNDGIKSQDGALIAQCAAADNGDDGIAVETRCVVLGCSAGGNGFFTGGTAGGGITLEGNGNRVQDNHLMGNENGLRADGGALPHPQYNLVIRNSAAGNLEDFRILSANNAVGVRTNVPGRAPAWANFDF